MGRAASCARPSWTIAADRDLPRSIVIRSTLLPGTAADIARAAPCHRPVRAHRPQPGVHAGGRRPWLDFLAPDRIVIGVDGHDDGAAGAAPWWKPCGGSMRR